MSLGLWWRSRSEEGIGFRDGCWRVFSTFIFLVDIRRCVFLFLLFCFGRNFYLFWEEVFFFCGCFGVYLVRGVGFVFKCIVCFLVLLYSVIIDYWFCVVWWLFV